MTEIREIRMKNFRWWPAPLSFIAIVMLAMCVSLGPDAVATKVLGNIAGYFLGVVAVRASIP
jgi:hypothetical protein